MRLSGLSASCRCSLGGDDLCLPGGGAHANQRDRKSLLHLCRTRGRQYGRALFETSLRPLRPLGPCVRRRWRECSWRQPTRSAACTYLRVGRVFLSERRTSKWCSLMARAHRDAAGKSSLPVQALLLMRIKPCFRARYQRRARECDSALGRGAAQAQASIRTAIFRDPNKVSFRLLPCVRPDRPALGVSIAATAAASFVFGVGVISSILCSGSAVTLAATSCLSLGLGVSPNVLLGAPAAAVSMGDRAPTADAVWRGP